MPALKLNYENRHIHKCNRAMSTLNVKLTIYKPFSLDENVRIKLGNIFQLFASELTILSIVGNLLLMKNY